MNNNDSIDALRSVSQGAGLHIIGHIVAKILGMFTNIILTRLLGTSLYGIYAFLNVILTLVQVFTRLGGDVSMLRYLPEYEEDLEKQQATMMLAYGTSLIVSIIAAGLIYYFAPLISRLTLSDPLFTDVLRIAAIVIPFNTLSNITLSLFKGIERMEYHVGISNIASPLFRLVFVAGGVLVGYSIIGAAAGLVVSGALTFLVGLFVLQRKTRLAGVSWPTKSQAMRHYNFSIPLTFNQFGNFLYNRIDILMVGFFLSGSVVGIYNISVVLATILVLPLTAFNQLFPPVASRLYQNSDIQELRDVYSTVTRWSFTLSLFPTIAMILYADEILRIFGSDFTRGAVVLILFSFGQFTNSAVGPSGQLLMMTNRQYLTLANQIGSGILNAILNYILILKLGFVGAALATATVLTFINILRLLQVWYLEGIIPYNREFFKPIIAGIGSGVVLYVTSIVFDQYTLLIVGGTAGGFSFLLLLYALGLDEDVQLLRRLLS